MTSMDTYWSLSGNSPKSSGSTSRVISPGIGVLVHDQLGELLLSGLSTR